MPGDKDIWDKVQAVGSIVSGIGIPIVLLLATQKAEQLQVAANAAEARSQAAAEAITRDRELAQGDLSLRVAQANIIPPLIDGLLSADVNRRKLAISAILIALPDDGPNLVRTLGVQSTDEDLSNFASSALTARKKKLVSDLYADDASVRKLAAGALIEGYKNDPDLAKALVERADQTKDNQDGVYNSVVVLGGLSKDALTSNRSAVEGFVKAAEKQGPATAAQAARVRSRLQ